MATIVQDPITGSQDNRRVNAFLRGISGGVSGYRFAVEAEVRGGNVHTPNLARMPSPTDSVTSDFGVQQSGGFTAEIVADSISPANFITNPQAATGPQVITLAVGTYTLWFIGLGTMTVAAGTASITGAGTATANGVGLMSTSITFVVTVAGTVTVTFTNFDQDYVDNSEYFLSDYVGTYV